MSIFVVIQQPGTNSEKLGAAVEKQFPQRHYELGKGTWLVAETGTASEVSTKLGTTPDGEAGSAVIVEVASYYGRANPAIWSWVKTNWEAKSG